MINIRLNKNSFIIFVSCFIFVLMVFFVLVTITTSLTGDVTDCDNNAVEVVVADGPDGIFDEIFYSFPPNGSIAQGDRLVAYVSDIAWLFSDKDISIGDEVKINFFLQEIPSYGNHSALNHAGRIVKTEN